MLVDSMGIVANVELPGLRPAPLPRRQSPCSKAVSECESSRALKLLRSEGCLSCLCLFLPLAKASRSRAASSRLDGTAAPWSPRRSRVAPTASVRAVSRKPSVFAHLVLWTSLGHRATAEVPRGWLQADRPAAVLESSR